jgi:hypothetical protein
LSPEQLDTLKTLAKRLGYLGRAESLVEASVLEGVTAIEPNSTPLAEADAKLPEKTNSFASLAPMSSAKYSEWRKDFLKANQPPTDGQKESW